ncbi:protein FAR1-RELATED SEQUENCE 5-like [Macadamia integrifolia]|uniref:protein FAR1-RELATED SEQUENCE 5-like n=1 Tax=Macadamia integrifolia TaxID=60698 RepID=UPI001C4F6354|nr:protein FAR1-RELATED SEQUENCE 5-like [Macadamia integrifolia]
MDICLVDDGKYKCREFVREHNHELHITSTVHMMRSQRNMLDIHKQEIDLADDSGIRPRSTVELMGSLMKYLVTQTRNNPSFTYSFQLDSEKQITKIFWADPKMIIDYAQFRDVVSFDTTFRTNKECRPFGLFAGFNHHRGYTVFRAALLYDETVESFEWLFEQTVSIKYVVTHFKELACTCMKFETDGILCCHCLKVLDVLDIKRIPEYYILKRWTRGARTIVVNDSRGKEVEQDDGIGDSISHISSQASAAHQSLDEDYI